MEFDSLPALRAQVADLRNQIRALGNVNISAIEEYQEVRERYDALSAQVADVEGSRNELTRMIASLSGQMKEIFTDSFRAINENFGRIFAELFGGGEASLCWRMKAMCFPAALAFRCTAGQSHQEPGSPFRRRTGAGGHQHLFCDPGRQPGTVLHPGRDRSRSG